MARQIINIGEAANDGSGDTIRDSFDKVNDNFAELYGNIQALSSDSTPRDIKGSVFADDSTLLVDGVNGNIPAANLSGALPAIDGSALTGVTVSTLAYSSLTGTPTTIAGYGITDAYTKTEVDNAITSSVLPAGSTQSIDIVAADSTVLVDSVNGTLNATTLTGALPAIDGSALTGITVSALDGDVKGSVFADDSTLLVDGVNGTLNATALTGALPAIDGSALTGVTTTETDPVVGAITGIVKSDGAGNISAAVAGTDYLTTVAFSDLTGTPTTLSGYGITDAYTKAEVDSSIASVTAGYFDFNITGDDSTVRTVSSGSTIGIVGGTGITTASDADGNITITASGGGGSGLQSRSTATGTTSSLADAAEADLDITGFKSYALLTITTDRAARVRLYVSAATRTADASRAEGVDPTSDAGLIAEVITTGADTVIISPGAYGFNLESSPTTTIPCRVTNKSGGTSTVQVDLNILQLEA